MNKLPKSLKKLLQLHMGRAWEAEMRAALGALSMIIKSSNLHISNISLSAEFQPRARSQWKARFLCFLLYK